MADFKTNEERLAEVQKAIFDILSGAQEAWYNGQRVRKADFEQLVKYEQMLMAKVARARTSGGIRVRGATPM